MESGKRGSDIYFKFQRVQKEAYIFSGLGADERVFQKLDLSAFRVNYIKWIPPEKSESIQNYAKRLLVQVNSANPILIGLSFGGLVAIEVAKLLDTRKVIIISSVKTKRDMPFYYRIAGVLHLHKLFPATIFKSAGFIANWFFGVKSTEEKNLLKQVLKETDAVFLKWAIDRLLRWSNKAELENIVHIHGNKDRLFPICFIKCDVTIQDGGHLMVYNRAEELTAIIKQEIQL